VEKKDVAFSKTVVQSRKKRKSQSWVLMIAKFGVEKVSSVLCQGHLERKS
jgi:hypothetical protein